MGRGRGGGWRVGVGWGRRWRGILGKGWDHEWGFWAWDVSCEGSSQ